MARSAPTSATGCPDTDDRSLPLMKRWELTLAERVAAGVFLFKVALRGNKRVRRRIAVRENQTLDDLHQAIFQAFDRDEEHLYSFYFPRPGARGAAALRTAVKYTHPDDADESVPSAAEVAVQSLGLVAGRSFLYLFDFGDEWWHEIIVESIDGAADEGTYPRIVDQRGESPPQYPDREDDDREEEE